VPVNSGGRKVAEWLLTPSGEKGVQAILSSGTIRCLHRAARSMIEIRIPGKRARVLD
jgi:hypothetical protein